MIFRQIFSSLPRKLQRLREDDQRFILIAVNGSGFLCRAVEDNLLPSLEAVLGRPVTASARPKVVKEYAIAILACCDAQLDQPSSRFLGQKPELLRETMAMLVLSEHDDKRNILEQARYSRNPDEAKIQANLSVLSFLECRDSSLIEKLRGMDFTDRWYEIIGSFMPGFITGAQRMPHTTFVESGMRSVKRLKPRSQSILDELVERMAAGDAVPKFPDAKRAVDAVPASRDSTPLHEPAGIPGDALKMANALMRLFKSGAAFELVDEEGARWIDELLRDAAHPVAPPDLKAEALAVRRYVGAVDGLPLTRAQARTFTARFETYLIENTAPNAQLARTFGQLRNWLATVYLNLEKAKAPISDDIRDWYTRIISVDRGAPVLVPDRSHASDAV